MKEKTSDGQIIIVLTEHPVLGILLIPYIAERLSDNTLQLVEQAFHASAEAMNRMSEVFDGSILPRENSLPLPT